MTVTQSDRTAEGLDYAQHKPSAVNGSTPLTQESLEQRFRGTAERHGLRVDPVFLVFRISVLCKAITRPLFESMGALGKDGVMPRLRMARDWYEQA